MADKKILVVFGATGIQGGSVIRSVLSSPAASAQFKIRAITRDPSKPAAQALASQGVECVTGDMNSKESLKEALQGAYAVFLVTNFWEHKDGEKETRQGITAVDVCKESGVQHLIWSTLRGCTAASNGKYTKAIHFDSKAKVDAHIKQIGIPATFFVAGVYMSTISEWIQQIPAAEGPPSLIFASPAPPSTVFPLIESAADSGKFVKAILLHREETLGKYISGSSGFYTADEIVSELGEVLGDKIKDSKYAQISEEDHKANMAKFGMDAKLQEGIVETFKSIAEFGYFEEDRDLLWSLSLLDEPTTTWKEYVARAPVFAHL